MLNLITVGNRGINTNRIISVNFYFHDSDNSEFSQADIRMSNDEEIVLAGMDAIVFEYWWSSLACDIHQFFADSAEE